jgi:hypothetical protein
LDFIIHAASLQAYNYGITPALEKYWCELTFPHSCGIDQGMRIIAATIVPAFNPKKVEENEEPSVHELNLLDQLPPSASLPDFYPADFEKDDDSNGHIGK